MTLRELLQLELTAYGVDDDEARVTLNGLKVVRPARAVHELTTNALKHGALGRLGGELAAT
ncbi:hypothetical protein [Paracraurococcus lichenis]|uniref:Uncharacterized protein n=1 Tax=Paracraurococcus lichenis TaxID=3064888 RepID=A0ABT9EBR5_9PROT|nr:hypothetical protein [Paracraurococcus sp. LOR1-02]MDO9713643.1 hypothetical protein [Paracraurococcus sp. LOR1-02]